MAILKVDAGVTRSTQFPSSSSTDPDLASIMAVHRVAAWVGEANSIAAARPAAVRTTVGSKRVYVMGSLRACPSKWQNQNCNGLRHTTPAMLHFYGAGNGKSSTRLLARRHTLPFQMFLFQFVHAHFFLVDQHMFAPFALEFLFQRVIDVRLSSFLCHDPPPINKWVKCSPFI